MRIFGNTWEVLVKLHWENELAINVVEGPEDDAYKHTDGEGGRGKDQVPGGAEGLDKVSEDRDDKEDELEEHVQEREVLPHTPELVPFPIGEHSSRIPLFFYLLLFTSLSNLVIWDK